MHGPDDAELEDDSRAEYPATAQTVRSYLTAATGKGLAVEQAERLIAKYDRVLRDGQAKRALAYYVGDLMCRMEGL